MFENENQKQEDQDSKNNNQDLVIENENQKNKNKEKEKKIKLLTYMLSKLINCLTKIGLSISKIKTISTKINNAQI